MKKLLLLFILLPLVGMAQDQKLPDNFSALNFFMGNWQSETSGKAGKGIGTQSYTMEMNGQYIGVKNETKFEASEKNPEGEVHQDWGMISFDENRGKIVYRQFNIEGYVNQYVLDHSKEGIFVFETEAIENVPAGFRARITLKVVDDNTYEEGFELAAPGKDYSGCIYNTWKRK
ncbi:hypothetical protein [Ancylomarina longa]|uniref:DUF1579 domain-containing protein n=1 Tax=Ancylomarina longa TaxID=2487017 RepID=A0A434AXL5_9BACT|nr:hypothetical protein [Ancylomarina longa]RUT79177.1 hypothetical protein DLK05_05000 [Ancylomarina longa]